MWRSPVDLVEPEVVLCAWAVAEPSWCTPHVLARVCAVCGAVKLTGCVFLLALAQKPK